jgi:hypothetical protein
VKAERARKDKGCQGVPAAGRGVIAMSPSRAMVELVGTFQAAMASLRVTSVALVAVYVAFALITGLKIG